MIRSIVPATLTLHYYRYIRDLMFPTLDADDDDDDAAAVAAAAVFYLYHISDQKSNYSLLFPPAYAAPLDVPLDFHAS